MSTKNTENQPDYKPKDWWEQMKSSRFAISGAVLGTTLLFPIAVIVGYRTYIEKKERTILAANVQKKTAPNPEDRAKFGSSGKMLYSLANSKPEPMVRPHFSAMIKSMQTTVPSTVQTIAAHEPEETNTDYPNP